MSAETLEPSDNQHKRLYSTRTYRIRSRLYYGICIEIRYSDLTTLIEYIKLRVTDKISLTLSLVGRFFFLRSCVIFFLFTPIFNSSNTNFRDKIFFFLRLNSNVSLKDRWSSRGKIFNEPPKSTVYYCGYLPSLICL